MFRSSLAAVVPAVAPPSSSSHSSHFHDMPSYHSHHAHGTSSNSATAAAFQYLLQHNNNNNNNNNTHNHTHAFHTTSLFPLQHARFGASITTSSDVVDDEVFQNLWYDAEQDDDAAAMRLSTTSTMTDNEYDDHDDMETEEDRHAVAMPPSSTNSLLFEPLDLPPKSTGSTGSLSLEQTLTDAFLNYTPDATLAAPPHSLSFDRNASQQTPVLSAALLQRLNSAYNNVTNNSNSNSQQQQQRSAMFYSNALHATHNEASVQSPPCSNSSLFNALLGLPSSSSPSMPWTTTSTTADLPIPSPPQSMQKLLLSVTTPSLSIATNNSNNITALLDPTMTTHQPLWLSALTAPSTTAMQQLPLGRKRQSIKKTRGGGATRSRLASHPNKPTALTLALAGLSHVTGSQASPTGCDSPLGSTGGGSDSETLSIAGSCGTKGKKCIESGCARRAQSNSRCKAHGGGARCQYAGEGGCVRSSQGGGFCRAHGGGKRCEFPDCVRGQQRKGRCYVHGGIRKCQMGTCEKKDRGNGFCIAHGGGKRCEHAGCSRAVRRGLLCQLHETAS